MNLLRLSTWNQRRNNQKNFAVHLRQNVPSKTIDTEKTIFTKLIRMDKPMLLCNIKRLIRKFNAFYFSCSMSIIWNGWEMSSCSFSIPPKAKNPSKLEIQFSSVIFYPLLSIARLVICAELTEENGKKINCYLFYCDKQRNVRWNVLWNYCSVSEWWQKLMVNYIITTITS